MADLSLDELRILSAFASGAPLRTVSESLGVDRSTLSRQVAALEVRVGEALFLRRGRKLLLTRFGERLATRARDVTTGLEDIAAMARSGPQRPLVISTSPLFAEMLLPEVIAAFGRAHPAVPVSVVLSHEYREIFESRIDVSIRRGPLDDSDSLSTRRLGFSTMLVVGQRSFSDAQLATASASVRAQARPWIRVGTDLTPLRLSLGTRREGLTVLPTYAVDSQRAAIELVRRGVGVARVNAYFVEDALASGELVEWLPEARTREGVHVVTPRGTASPANARSFIASLMKSSAGHPFFER